MARRDRIELSREDHDFLATVSRSRTERAVRVQRAEILLRYADNMRISVITKMFRTNRPLVERVIDRAVAYGVKQALNDLPRPGRPATITDEAKAWVLSIACRKPTELGYAHETWTYSLLLAHIHQNCLQAKHGCLKLLGKGRLNSILSKGSIKPHKISYYLEKRDQEFDQKMADVLCVYKDVELTNEKNAGRDMVTISFDEKPGIQAIKNIAPQLQPVPNKHSTIARDHEYKRLGTVSLLAGIDLHTGIVTPLVEERHRSREFTQFLDKLDQEYPREWKIRIVLDNHSAHTSKETRKYLLSKPGRFQFVFTPKHGSWLNMIEMFFSKIARSFLRHIRVETKQELIQRIYQGIQEINKTPVIFRWRYKMDEIAVA
jgi:transposase